MRSSSDLSAQCFNDITSNAFNYYISFFSNQPSLEFTWRRHRVTLLIYSFVTYLNDSPCSLVKLIIKVLIQLALIERAANVYEKTSCVPDTFLETTKSGTLVIH